MTFQIDGGRFAFPLAACMAAISLALAGCDDAPSRPDSHDHDETDADHGSESAHDHEDGEAHDLISLSPSPMIPNLRLHRIMRTNIELLVNVMKARGSFTKLLKLTAFTASYPTPYRF